ncbi:Ryanodine receptor 1, partial [Frankliniella fusca]
MSVTAVAGGLGHAGSGGGVTSGGVTSGGGAGGGAGGLEAELSAEGGEYRIRFTGSLGSLDSLDPSLPPAPAPSPAPLHPVPHSAAPAPAPASAPGSQYSITGLLQSLGAGDCGLG